MPTQLSGTTAVLVSETTATSYFIGGTFSLGAGPFTSLNFSADDEETDFASFGAQYGESWGAGRQTGTLTDGGGGTYDQGLASLEDVLTLTHPTTSAQILVGRVSLRVDTGSPGGGAETQNFYIFSGPIDPAVVYNVTSIEYTPGSSPSASYAYNDFAGGGVVCFAAGTLIMTEHGQRPVERLHEGLRVQTADNGLMPIVWMGNRRCTRTELASDSKLHPVSIAPGALGNRAELLVSQQHRLVIGDRFIKAKHLAHAPSFPARIARGKKRLSYHHILLESHNVLFANGAPAESLFLGPVTNRVLTTNIMCNHQNRSGQVRATLHDGLCRPVAKRHEVENCRKIGAAAHARLVCKSPPAVPAKTSIG